MPKYELMYIIGSHISESDVPGVIAEIKQKAEALGGQISKQEEIGKKKLAYPIKNKKNGYYVLLELALDPQKANDLEHELQTNQSVIRHLLLNVEEASRRMEKDRAQQARMKPKREAREAREAKAAQVEEAKQKPSKKIEIDLDAEIEKALKSDELK